MFSELALVLALAALIAFYAVIWGGHPERWCALIILGGIVADRVIVFFLGPRSFEGFEFSRFAIDGAQMALLLVVALRANRLYPIGIASAQLLTVLGSLSAVFVVQGWTQAYWAMTQTPLFLQLIILAVGTLAHSRRRARIGNYNSWSPSTIGRPDRA